MWVAIVGSRELGQCNCGRKIELGHPHPESCALMRDYLRVLHIVAKLLKGGELEGIVSGGARGADTLARMAAEVTGFTIENGKFKEIRVQGGTEPFHTRAKRRNAKIVKQADLVIALFAAGPRSPGTQDTIEKAIAAGKPVHVWDRGQWRTS